MQPIYNELINMWKSEGIDLQLIEGVFWLDKQIVKAFNKEGKPQNLYHIFVADDLSISYKKCNQSLDIQAENYETWNETISRIKLVFHYTFCPINTAI